MNAFSANKIQSSERGTGLIEQMLKTESKLHSYNPNVFGSQFKNERGNSALKCTPTLTDSIKQRTDLLLMKHL